MYRFSIGIMVFAALLLAHTSDYNDSIGHWQRERDAKLRADDSWLTLAGLFWLKPGDNTIGSADSNDFVLPKDAPAQVGRLRLNGNKVTFTAADGPSRTLAYKNEDKPD